MSFTHLHPPRRIALNILFKIQVIRNASFATVEVRCIRGPVAFDLHQLEDDGSQLASKSKPNNESGNNRVSWPWKNPSSTLNAPYIELEPSRSLFPAACRGSLIDEADRLNSSWLGRGAGSKGSLDAKSKLFMISSMSISTNIGSDPTKVPRTSWLVAIFWVALSWS